MIDPLRQKAADIAADIIGVRRADKHPQYFIFTPKNHKKAVGFDRFIDEVNKIYLLGDDRRYLWKQRAEEIRKLTGVEQMDEELFAAVEVIRDIANARKQVEIYGLQKAYRAVSALEEYAVGRIDKWNTQARQIRKNMSKDQKVYKEGRMDDRAFIRDKRHLQDELEDITADSRPHMHLVDGLWNIRQGLEQIMDKLNISPLPRENSLER